METKKRITFVVNPISGTHGKEFILRLIEKELNHSIYDYSIRKTEYAGHAFEIAAQAAAGCINHKGGCHLVLQTISLTVPSMR